MEDKEFDALLAMIGGWMRSGSGVCGMRWGRKARSPQ